MSKKKPAKMLAPRKDSASRTTKFEKLIRRTADEVHYKLKLYVAGASPRSGQAIANVRSLCDECLPSRYELEVIDIYQQPGVAVTEQIIAAPTLVKAAPAPPRRMIGDLSNRDKILVGLSILAVNPKTVWVKV